MAKAADNTIAFVKEWIEGKLTKRQYMHYYIVKTPDAQFLMKANEGPDLVAIKDSSGHIFIPDDALQSYNLKEETAQRNPFFALLASGFQFSYSLLAENSIGEASARLSKWKTLDRIQVHNADTDMDIHISLIQIGDGRYITEAGYKDGNFTVKDWSTYEDLKKRVLKDTFKLDKVQPYLRLRAVAGKPTKVMDVRGAFLEYAGDQANTALVTEDWIFIPTEKKLVNEVTDPNIHAILKTRPMAYHYGLTEDIINLEAAWQRTEYPFFPDQLSHYNTSSNFVNTNNLPGGKTFITSGHQWREWLRRHIDAEMADGVIKFIEDDDAWLMENGYIMQAFSWGRKFKSDLFLKPFNGYTLVVEETNPSICDKHVVYIKGKIFDSYSYKTTIDMPYFTKVIPAPHTNMQHSIEEFTTHVRG